MGRLEQLIQHPVYKQHMSNGDSATETPMTFATLTIKVLGDSGEPATDATTYCGEERSIWLPDELAMSDMVCWDLAVDEPTPDNGVTLGNIEQQIAHWAACAIAGDTTHADTAPADLIEMAEDRCAALLSEARDNAGADARHFAAHAAGRV